LDWRGVRLSLIHRHTHRELHLALERSGLGEIGEESLFADIDEALEAAKR
jgi:hypothetical protein